MEKLIIDSDALINWLVQEREKGTNLNLWMAPATILELGEAEQLSNHISLLSIFEIRFVLRRKKNKDPKEIEKDIHTLHEFLHIEVPSGNSLLQANQLQSEWPLDPFDSILLAQAISNEATLISRDIKFLKIAKQYIACYSPEEYIDKIS